MNNTKNIGYCDPFIQKLTHHFLLIKNLLYTKSKNKFFRRSIRNI